MKTIVRALASLSRRTPWLIIILTIGLTGLFGYLSGQVTLATGNEGFAPEGAEIGASERIAELFGEESTESTVQVLVVSDTGDVINLEGLRAAIAAEQAIRGSEVGSHLSDRPDRPGTFHFLMAVLGVMDAQGVTMDQMTDEMVKQFFMAAFEPDSGFPPEMVSILTRLVSEDFDPNTVTASGGMVLAFVNSFEGNADEAFNAQIEAERDMAEALANVDTPLRLLPFSFGLLLSGFDDFTDEVGRLFGIAFLVILGILLFVYWLPPGRSGTKRASIRRTVVDTLLTLLTVVMAVVWMQGIGYLLEQMGVITAFSAITQIVPILLISLGIDYAIHLTSRYREQVGKGDTVDNAMTRAINTVGVSLVLATVTTVIGFLTNVFNPVPALADFGILAAVGIVVAFVLMLTFVPSVRLIADRRAERRGTLPVDSLGDHGDRIIPKIMEALSVLAKRAPVPTLIVALVLGVLGWVGFTQLETKFSFTDFLPDDSPYVETMTLLQEQFGGGFGEQTQVLIEAGPSEPIDASVHNRLVAANQSLATLPDVSTVETPQGPFINALSPIAVLGQLMAGGPEATPPGLLAAAAEVGLEPGMTVAPGSDITVLYRAMLEVAPDMAARVISMDGTAVAALLWDITTTAGEDVGELRTGLDAAFQPVRDEGVSAIAVSENIIGDVIVSELTASQSSSLLITVAVAGLVLVISFAIESRRPFLGVIAIAPVALVVLWTYGLMYLVGIPFGPVTATLAALAIGIGVPFTIHIARRFEEDRKATSSAEQAMRSTMRHTGGALAGTAFTTVAGFGVLMTASLVPFRQMGQVTAFAIALCLVAAVLVLPSMLALWDMWHRKRGDKWVGSKENRPLEPSEPLG